MWPSAFDLSSMGVGAINCLNVKATLIANCSWRGRISIKVNVQEGLSTVSLKYKAEDLYPPGYMVFV